MSGERPAVAPWSYGSIVGSAALWFGLVGPMVPFPALALIAFVRSGAMQWELLSDSLRVYPVALLVGGLGAAGVGLLYGVTLVLIDRSWPRAMLAKSTVLRVGKAILFPLAFTAVVGGGGSLLVALTVPLILARTAAFQVQLLGDPAGFAAPTLLCGILFTYWVLPRLPSRQNRPTDPPAPSGS